MQVEEKGKNRKLDGISYGKTVRRTTPLKASQPSNIAKVRKDIESTKQKLRNLAERWKGINQVRGFLTELWEALGIDTTNNSQQRGGNPSRYAAFQLQDGTMLTVTIRASAHNANAKTYIKDENVIGDTNISIVLQNRRKKNAFVPHDDVKLSEYVYVEDKMAMVESPLSQIAMSLVGYLTDGKYVDTTGVAIPHTSPQNNNQEQINCNRNMKKKVKLSESKLKNIISRIIKEEFSDATTFNKSLWVIVPNAALEEAKSKGGLFPYNGDISVVTKGVYLCNDKNAIQAYRSPNSSYVEVDFGKLMSSLKGTRNANIQKRDFNGAIMYIVPYVPSDCISSVEPCGRGGQLQEEKHLNKLTESDLHRIVKESVNRVLNEVSTDTLHNAYQKSNKLTMKMPPFSDDPKIQRRFRQKHTFGDELEKRHGNEISAIDPDTTQGYGADFYEHPELRNTKAYKIAYDWVSGFDWFVNGDIDLDRRSLRDLASDVQFDTQIPSSIAQQAIVDYLRNEFGYEID